MPPNSKKKTQEEEDSTLPEVSSLEHMLDNRFDKHMKELHQVVLNNNKVMSDELNSIKLSQQFISDNFNDLLKAFNAVREENSLLKSENLQLKSEVLNLKERLVKLEDEQENINLYSRRNCLEFNGIPDRSGENTDEIVMRIGELVGVEIDQSDISVSHRLPNKRGRIPSIIAKFTRRSVRDRLYKSKGNLNQFNSSNVCIDNSSEALYINESLTPKARNLFFRVRLFKKTHRFKYVWTKYGIPFLKKSDEARIISFESSREFDDFEAKYTN